MNDKSHPHSTKSTVRRSKPGTFPSTTLLSQLQQEADAARERVSKRNLGTELDNGQVRVFTTGATRDTSQEKLELDGFLAPAVVLRFAQYMHKHRHQSDGKLRAADNWQKGIPRDAYMQSLMRHMLDLWLRHRGKAGTTGDSTEDVLCALLFNVQGYLFEVLRDDSSR